MENLYNSVEIGKRLYLARKNSKFTQTEAANHLEINQSQYSRIELGEANLDAEQLFKLADLYNVRIEWILGLKVSSNDDYLIKLFKDFLEYRKSR